MSGTLVYVCGPSGAGKDSLIQAAGQLLGSRIRIAKRYITRPADAGWEEHVSITAEEFLYRRERGEFCFYWERHGLCYGLGREVEGWLAEDRLVLVNGSRVCLPDAEKHFPQLQPVLITADPAITAQRLKLRNRERGEELNDHLKEAQVPLAISSEILIIDNSGPLEIAAELFCCHLNQLAGEAEKRIRKNKLLKQLLLNHSREGIYSLEDRT
jgi:ribose 1,5-bisphosphokinase